MVLNTGIKLLPPFQNMLLKKTLQPGENKGIYIAIPVLNIPIVVFLLCSQDFKSLLLVAHHKHQPQGAAV